MVPQMGLQACQIQLAFFVRQSCHLLILLLLTVFLLLVALMGPRVGLCLVTLFLLLVVLMGPCVELCLVTLHHEGVATPLKARSSAHSRELKNLCETTQISGVMLPSSQVCLPFGLNA